MKRGVMAAVTVATLFVPSVAQGQIRLRDLVVNLGGTVDDYAGNLSAGILPVVDTTDHATAVVGEVGVRGVVSLFGTLERSLEVSFDGGVRQTAATGFELRGEGPRDFAPREWAGSLSGRFTQALGTWGVLSVRGGVRGRTVVDRPPPPLYVQPGYATRQGGFGLATRSLGGVSFDAQGEVESADYQALDYLPQLDLLDRSAVGFEVGARWGAPATIRFYGGVRWTEYENQGSFYPPDPFRRDRTTRVGVEWTYPGNVFAQVGLDGTLNRSNSFRPEYDALSVRALLTAPLPREFSLNVFLVVTAKTYLHEVDFPRLVPGEEADNASVAYLQIGRPLASNLDGAVRLAWSRAETDIGSAYYRRVGGSLQFNYRPLGR